MPTNSPTVALRRLAVAACLMPLAAALADTVAGKPERHGGGAITVRADVFFTPTGIAAGPNESFLVVARTGDTVDLSTLNGGYRTLADGTIAATPPADSGATEFFRDRAGPIYSDPVAGSRKSFLPLTDTLPGHLPGAPYGALVAGFSPSAAPGAFADFPNGFQLINGKGIARAPASGGYLFLGVNDFNNAWGDNGGAYRVQVYRLHGVPYEPGPGHAADTMLTPAPAPR
jgi:hypothetical protein